MIDIKELTTKYTNEAGEVDYERLNNEINEINQTEINKIAKKKDDKMKKKLSDLELEKNAEIEKSTTDLENDKLTTLENHLKAMEESINGMNAEKQRFAEIEVFKTNAKSLNVNDEVINQFVDSNADLTKIDLNKFKQVNQNETPIKIENKTENKNEVSSKSILDEFIASKK